MIDVDDQILKEPQINPYYDRVIKDFLKESFDN